jgi:DNA-binding transcriptional MerR regulator
MLIAALCVPIAPSAAVQDTQVQVLKRICQYQKVDVSIDKCRDFYSAYPTGFVADAATEIFDMKGEHVDSCGGNRFFASDRAREEAERKCASYLVSCMQVVESCRSLR